MIRFVRSRSICLVVWLVLFACSPASPEPVKDQGANTAPARRALLVGINDYSASLLPPAPPGLPPGRRSVPNLSGAVNDVQAMQQMLVALYGFKPQDILILTDQAATRQAILRAIKTHLIEPSSEGDIAFFYFSGHGSQQRNSLSKEQDRLDETIVPADSLRGAPDIRDKELRSLFNRILDRSAHLTIALDSCHSASGARGLFVGARFRSAEPNLHDLKDSALAGPRPEDRGALVFSAAQEHDLAWESWDEQGKPHGAFSLALIRALRDSVAGEPAEETFLRARARLQAEKRFQEPVLAGIAKMRRTPFLAQRAGQRTSRMVVAVEKVRGDGTVVLQGGFANGLTEGSELRVLPPDPEVRIEVTAIHGFSRSEGRILPGPGRAPLVTPKPGALAEVVSWTAFPGGPLRVWMPSVADVDQAAALARELAREAPRQEIGWVEDPTRERPSHVLRWHAQGWELLTEKTVERLGPAIEAPSVLARIREKAAEKEKEQEPFALFVQLPAPVALVTGITLGPGTDHAGVEAVCRPDEADYVLVGRLAAGGLEYAWLRPGTAETDRRQSSLPVRTAWHPLGDRRPTGLLLEDAVLRLRKIHGWLHLDTPSGAASPYELALRKAGEKTCGELVADGILIGQQEYCIVFRAKPSPLPTRIEARYFYVFLIDSFGKSILLFPSGPSGSVGNLFPVTPGAPAEISLEAEGTFPIIEPYGVDTYFLLTSDEPIPNPEVVQWDGVRTRGPRGQTFLEELLSVTGGADRSAAPLLTPARWSVERKVFTSVPPGAPSGSKSKS